MRLAIALIISIFSLVFFFALGTIIEAPLQEALAISNSLERPLILVLQFLLTNPIGLFIDWLVFTSAIVGISLV